jgi:amino acid transporter
MRGVEEGKWVQNIFTFTKAAILILFVVIGLWVLRGTGIADQNPREYGIHRVITLLSHSHPSQDLH